MSCELLVGFIKMVCVFFGGIKFVVVYNIEN